MGRAWAAGLTTAFPCAASFLSPPPQPVSVACHQGRPRLQSHEAGGQPGAGAHTELALGPNNEFSSRVFERVHVPNRAVNSARHALRSSQGPGPSQCPTRREDGV